MRKILFVLFSLMTAKHGLFAMESYTDQNSNALLQVQYGIVPAHEEYAVYKKGVTGIVIRKDDAKYRLDKVFYVESTNQYAFDVTDYLKYGFIDLLDPATYTYASIQENEVTKKFRCAAIKRLSRQSTSKPGILRTHRILMLLEENEIEHSD